MVCGARLLHAPVLGRAGRGRVGHLSSGIKPRGPHGFGGQHGLAQSIFQVGGNAGASIGPLLAAFIVVPLGQYSLRYFSLLSLLALLLLIGVGAWYKRRGPLKPKADCCSRAGH